MESIPEIKIQNLVFEGNSEILHRTFDSIREDLGLTIKEFEDILQTNEGQKLYEVYDNVIAEFLTSRFSKANFRQQLSISRRNELAIIKENQALLQSYFDYVHSVHIVYTNLISAVFKKRKRYSLSFRDAVNISLYGNLCRKSDEIGLLLRNGFPDAALVLWRTFYEYGVIASFLLKEDSEKLATQFADAGNRDVFKKATSFNNRAKDLKFRPLHKKVAAGINNEYEELKKKYPKDFFINDYGWAFGFISPPINFRKIEEIVGFGRFRPFYIWASEKSHPNFHGITDFRNTKRVIVPQRVIEPNIDKIAMIDPAQLTLSVFDQVNQGFFEKYSVESEIDTNFTIFRKLYEKFSSTL